MDDLPLIEKYRPKNLDDIIGNKNEIKFLKKFIDKNIIPNIIINGNPGTGKTSSILVFIKKYLGDDYENNCLELNASDDRGIDSVRNKITIFSKKKIKNNKLKIVLLDEADNMTNLAQYSLKRIIENFRDNTRFFFTCNSIENIIKSLQSECLIMNFGNIEINDIFNLVKKISKLEKMNISDESINSIIKIKNIKNDIRNILNILETIIGNFNSKKRIENKDIVEFLNRPSPDLILHILDKLINKELEIAMKIIIDIKNNGFNNFDILNSLNNEIINLKIDSKIKSDCITLISQHIEIYFRGFDSKLQLLTVIIKLFDIINEIKQYELV